MLINPMYLTFYLLVSVPGIVRRVLLLGYGYRTADKTMSLPVVHPFYYIYICDPRSQAETVVNCTSRLEAVG